MYWYCVLACNNSNTNQVQNNANLEPTPSPSPQTPQEKSAQSEKETQNEDSFENRAKARQAVVDYVKNSMPGQTIDGISLLSYTGNLYVASVDLSSAKKPQAISLLVRMYVKDNGETYWKAHKLTEDDKRLLISRRARKFKELFQDYNQLAQDYDSLAKSYQELEEENARLTEPPDEEPEDSR